jgi:hypothetical protein
MSTQPQRTDDLEIEDYDEERDLPWLAKARREMNEAMASMTSEERIAYIEARAAKFRERMVAREQS